MLKGVVERGTGRRIAAVGKPLAGKTGTTNEERDTWFVGFSPDLAVGVFIGFDDPLPLGRRETGSSVAAPFSVTLWLLLWQTNLLFLSELHREFGLCGSTHKLGCSLALETKNVISEALKDGTSHRATGQHYRGESRTDGRRGGILMAPSTGTGALWLRR